MAIAIIVAAQAAMAAEAPEDSIQFHCMDAAGIDFESEITCRDSRTGAAITPVPAGFYLFVTDIVVAPDNTAAAGTFNAIPGRSDTSPLPAVPSLDLLGSPSQQLQFTTPYIVLREGEMLAVANSTSSDFPIDIRISGHLAETLTAPLADEIFADGFEH